MSLEKSTFRDIIIRVNNRVFVQIEGSDILIKKDGQLRCSGFEDGIDYLLFHCYFNDITYEDVLTILKAFQNYYMSNILQKNKKEQSELTELLCGIHNVILSHKPCLHFFRKIGKNPKIRNNIQFWEGIFDVYFGSGHEIITKLAYRRMLRINLHNKELWALLLEFYDTSCRTALIKRIMNDIEKR